MCRRPFSKFLYILIISKDKIHWFLQAYSLFLEAVWSNVTSCTAPKIIAPMIDVSSADLAILICCWTAIIKDSTRVIVVFSRLGRDAPGSHCVYRGRTVSCIMTQSRCQTDLVFHTQLKLRSGGAWVCVFLSYIFLNERIRIKDVTFGGECNRASNHHVRGMH